MEKNKKEEKGMQALLQKKMAKRENQEQLKQMQDENWSSKME